MTANIVDEFVNYLSARHFNAASLLSKLNSTSRRNGERTLKDLWEASDLSANDFADEVAQFYHLPRVALPQLIAASALTAKFSRRFLRETLVFPYSAEDGRPRLVLADPTDAAAVRAAEIVLGQAIAVEIASYEDIATALTKRLEGQQIPSHFEKLLIREYDVPEDYAQRLMGHFAEGAKDAGMLNAQGIITSGNVIITPGAGSLQIGGSTLSGIGAVEPAEVEADSDVSVSFVRGYSVRITGPGIDSRIAIKDEDDVEIVEAMLKKVRRLLKAELEGKSGG